MEKSQAVDYTSIDYLEGLEAEPQSVSAGSDILAEAARYHVDLDTLETVGSSAAVPVQPPPVRFMLPMRPKLPKTFRKTVFLMKPTSGCGIWSIKYFAGQTVRL